MSFSINKVTLYGNLTRDPELKKTQSGLSICAFSIATNRTWKDKSGQKQEDVQYHNIVAWGRTGELISQYMKKGSGLFVEGRLQTRSWQDKTGAKRYTTEIVAEQIQFGPRGSAGRVDNQEYAGPQDTGATIIDETTNEDIPF